MNLALTAKGPGLGAWLDPDFGQSMHVMIMDERNRFKTWPNAYRETGVGDVALAHQLVEKQVDAVVTGVMHPDAYAILAEADIPVYLVEVDAILTLADAVREGALQPADVAAVQARFAAREVTR